MASRVLPRVLARQLSALRSFQRQYSITNRNAKCKSIDKPESYVMGIESSCDDTGVAIVSTDGTIVSNIVCSQADIHAAWGGVVPKLAQEAHMRAIDGCVEQALEEAGVSPQDLSAVGVTVGPGLSLCLRVGVTKAKEICSEYNIDMIPVHHMEAHALVARLTNQHENVQFPFLCLLVSGGHNLLLIVEGLGRYVQLGTTLDDALGEAYDKIARLLEIDLSPSGGASIEKIAKQGDEKAYTFPIPLKKRQTCDFSFAGLKTSVRLAIERERNNSCEKGLTEATKADIAASFQSVAVKHLDERVRRAFVWARETDPNIRHLIIAGGVASNQYLRACLQDVCKDHDATLVCPPPSLCTDNGAMVAWAAIERMRANLPIQTELDAVLPDGSPKPDDWLDLKPRWPLTERRDSRGFQAPRSAKKKNIHRSLELLTQQEDPAAI